MSRRILLLAAIAGVVAAAVLLLAGAVRLAGWLHGRPPEADDVREVSRGFEHPAEDWLRG